MIGIRPGKNRMKRKGRLRIFIFVTRITVTRFRYRGRVLDTYCKDISRNTKPFEMVLCVHTRRK